MRPKHIPLTLVACALLLALTAASALANASDNRIVQDCQRSATGELTGTYTKAQLNHALNNLPGDVIEYSGCYDAIKQALLGTASGGRSGGSGAGGANDGGSGGGSGAGAGGAGSAGSGDATAANAGGGAGLATPSTPPPPDAARPLTLAGAAVAPGALPVIGRDSRRLPSALVVLLALLGVAALVPGALTIGRRVVAARRP